MTAWNFKPVGHCIYCGSTVKPLGKEHILAFGLGGDLVLPRSSCTNCAKSTGTGIEDFCLRKMFIHLRVRHNMPTRNPQKRPNQFPISVHNADGTITEKIISGVDLPRESWVFPVYDAPGFVQQTAPDECPDPGYMSVMTQDDANILVKHGGGNSPVSMESGELNIDLFSRMLAKIAHSFAYAMLGKDGFRPVLPELILKGSSKYLFWVGCNWKGCEFDGPQIEYDIFRLTLFEVAVWNGQKSLAVGIRLFSFLGTPQYVVIVGGSTGDGFSLLKNRNYTKSARITSI